MSHLSDKDIDHLAREAADQLDVDQNSSGWEALQSRLDEEMPAKKRRRRWFLFLIFPLMGGILFYAYKVNERPVTITLAPETQQSASGSASNAPAVNSTGNGIPEQAEGVRRNNGNITKPAETHISNLTKTENPAPVQVIADRVPSHQQEQLPLSPNGTTTTVSAAPEKLLLKKQRRESLTSRNKESLRNPPSSDPNSQSAPTAKNLSASTGADPRSPITEKHEDINTEMMNTPDLLSNPTSPPVSAGDAGNPLSIKDSTGHQQKKAPVDSAVVMNLAKAAGKKSSSKTLMPYKGIAMGVIMGPDISEVNKKGIDKTGINIGIMATYRFSGRLSLVSGLSYTHKFYTAYGKDYKPAKGTWLDTVSIDKVVGDCYMYEIPVNLRFDLVASKKNYLFISAGLSSYFMKKENYDFHYTTNAGQYYNKYRSYKVSESYLFKVLNLSVGYERMLTPRLSLQLEPYVKLPLNGLGYGNMQLSSYGAFVGVKYHSGMLKAR